MVQNVNPANANPGPQKKGGFLNSLSNTATIALPGAVMGGTVGGVLSLLPPKNSAIRSELFDLFVAEGEGKIKSQSVLDLLNRPEFKEINENIMKNFKEENQEGFFNAIGDFFKKIKKDDELFVLAKKAAKSKNAKTLIRNGALFGVICILLVNLIQSRKNKKK